MATALFESTSSSPAPSSGVVAIPSFSLLGKKVFITGGSRGIGRACALTLASAGADVAIGASPSGEASARQVCAEVEELGRRARAYCFDIGKSGAVTGECGRINDDFEGIDFDERRFAFVAHEGFYNTPYSLARGLDVKSEAEARAWAERMRGIPRYFAEQRANLERGVATGWTHPGVVIDVAVAVLRNQIAVPAADDPMLASLIAYPAVRAEAQRLIDAYDITVD